METKHKDSFKKLLDQLQIESWQLELLVSGFVIFLVGGSFEGIYSFTRRIKVIEVGLAMDIEFLSIFPTILLGSAFFIFINLILHVVFRGMWISAIGLRSISGEIDFEVLNFTRPFDKFMRKKLGSFDKFIQRLEDISSVIFAFTFMIVFMMISVALFFIFFLSFVYIINAFWDSIPDSLEFLISILLALIFFIGILYFLDFMTLGFFKRKRWIAIWYFPIYRFMSLITFSWLYRPLYYNLIDNKFGRRVGLLLVPYFIIIVLLATTETNINEYIPKNTKGLEINDRYFEDARDKKERIRTISIPSKYISNGYLDLFIYYNALNNDKVISELSPDLIPDESSGFRSSSININFSDDEKSISSSDTLLYTVSQLYDLYIDDSLYQNLDYYFYQFQNYGEEGIRTIVDINHLPRGKHQLKINRQRYIFSKDTAEMQSYISTPFWVE